MWLKSVHWSLWLALAFNVFAAVSAYLNGVLVAFGLSMFSCGELAGYLVFRILQDRRERRRAELAELERLERIQREYHFKFSPWGRDAV